MSVLFGPASWVGLVSAGLRSQDCSVVLVHDSAVLVWFRSASWVWFRPALSVSFLLASLESSRRVLSV